MEGVCQEMQGRRIEPPDPGAELAVSRVEESPGQAAQRRLAVWAGATVLPGLIDVTGNFLETTLPGLPVADQEADRIGENRQRGNAAPLAAHDLLDRHPLTIVEETPLQAREEGIDLFLLAAERVDDPLIQTLHQAAQHVGDARLSAFGPHPTGVVVDGRLGEPFLETGLAVIVNGVECLSADRQAIVDLTSQRPVTF